MGKKGYHSGIFTIGARETHVGRQGSSHTTVMSGLGLRWAEFILSCCSDGGLVLEVFHPNIPPWVVLVVGVVLSFFFFSFPCKLLLNVSLCWSRVWSWLDFNVTSVVGLEGKRSIPAVLHGGRHSWLSINCKRHDPPTTPKRERAYLIYRMESHHTAAKSTKNGNKNNHRRNHYSAPGTTALCYATRAHFSCIPGPNSDLQVMYEKGRAGTSSAR